MRSSYFRISIVLLVLLTLVVTGCNRRRTPVAAPAPPPATTGAPPGITPAPTPPQRVEEALPVPQQPALADDEIGSRTLDELNRNSPLKPVFFALDSSDLDEEGRATAAANAEILKRNADWAITIEGHADERGTAEYNLALGERRALTIKTFLVSLGIPAERIRTVSYGKEFPFDPARSEEAYAKNRRGHFVITSN